MLEHSAFEARLQAALEGYVGRLTSDLDPVELARRIASRQPRRHRVFSALAQRGVAIPARVWVLLVLAALLTGLVAGLGVVGWPSPELPAVVPMGQSFVCPLGSTPDKPGPVDQARPVRPKAASFDRRAGRVVALADDGHGVQTWTFDVCANTWTRMNPVQEPTSFDWGMLVYDVDSDVTILASSSGWIWAYDLPSDTWTQKGPGPMAPAPTYVQLWAYDPLTGLVVAGSTPRSSDMWTYRVETDTWSLIAQTNGPPEEGMAVYDASIDRIVFPRHGARFDLRTGRWSWLRSGAEMPQVIAGYGMSSPGIVYDEAAERTVVFGNERLVAYDAAAERWEIVADGLSYQLWPAPMVSDPVNERLIGWNGRFLGPDDPADLDVGGVVAVDLVTREWTILLETRWSEGPQSSSE